jgi:NADH-quinone oxidoreductase subunit D
MTRWPDSPTLAPGEAEFDTVDMTINIGPQHPATHGVFRMVLTVDGELVGLRAVHRLPAPPWRLRSNDYRQAMGFWDRTDYLAGICCEGAYCMAVEKLAGIDVPERAEYIRVLLMELSRINSHFMFLGAFGADVGSVGTSFIYWRERGQIYDFLEEVSGTHVPTTSAPAAWRGPPEGWEARVRALG